MKDKVEDIPLYWLLVYPTHFSMPGRVVHVQGTHQNDGEPQHTDASLVYRVPENKKTQFFTH